MKRETCNLLRRCSNPFVCGRVISFFIRRIIFSFQYRYCRSTSQYPKEVREVFNEMMNSVFYNFFLPILQLPSPLEKGDSDGQRTGGCLKLATGFFDYDGEPEWRKEFNDPEQTMSLHRWHWLIYEDRSSEWGLALIRSWLSVMGPIPNRVGGTPYTTGERIVNALLFFNQKEVPEDLRAALLAMAWHLAKNLEYHGARGTGNHVVNEARALFFAGQMFDIKPLSALALAILKDALPRLITKDGFLREESSHYHLLFTRWLIEIYEIARKTNDQTMQEYLEPWVKICASQCWFFLVENGEKGAWQIPLIGDVSPDCAPEWLILYLKPRLEQYKPDLWPTQGIKSYEPSGWFRLDWKNFTIFWHLPQVNMIHRPHHGHSDACSFALFYKGKPMLIDPGRSTYCANDLLSQSSISAQGHNSLAVDGLGPFVCDKEQKFPAFYQQREVKINYKEKNQLFIFSITQTGFQRLRQDSVNHIRSFKIGNDFLEIEDKLDGQRQHILETFFHWAPEVKVMARGDNQYEAGPMMFTVSAQDARVINYDDWSFPKYGEKAASHSLSVRQYVGLPIVNSYYFKF